MDAFIDNIRVEEAKRYLLEAGLLPEEVQDDDETSYIGQLHTGVAEELELIAATDDNALIRKVADEIADRVRRDERYLKNRKVVRKRPGSISEYIAYENIDEFEAREGTEWRLS